MKQKTLFIIAAVALLAVFLAGALIYKSGGRSGQLAESKRIHLTRMHSPTLGPAQAKVHIVEFLDPACETCRVFYPLVKEMMAAHPGQIHLTLRYAPFHNGSDAVVAVLEAARKQGKFWQALEALLAAQTDWAPHHTPQLALVWPHMEGLGLNMEQLRVDMMAPEIAQVITQDLADAQALNVTQTPEFFVNGAPLPTFGYEPLKALVDAALAAP